MNNLCRSILSDIKKEEIQLKRKAKTQRWEKHRCFEKMQVQNQVVKAQNMITHRRRYAIHKETKTHRQWAEIAAKKRSPFMPHRGLADLYLFLDTMLNRRTWEACPIDCTEGLSNIYGNGSQTCYPKGKTYRYAQLGELIHSIVVEHTPKHEVIYGSKPVGEKHGEGETGAER
jgi:hypothetical protein